MKRLMLMCAIIAWLVGCGQQNPVQTAQEVGNTSILAEPIAAATESGATGVFLVMTPDSLRAIAYRMETQGSLTGSGIYTTLTGPYTRDGRYVATLKVHIAKP